MSDLLCGACQEEHLTVKALRIVLPWKGLCQRHYEQYLKKEFCEPCQQGGVRRFATHRMNGMRMCREHQGAAAIVDGPPVALVPDDVEVKQEEAVDSKYDIAALQADRDAGMKPAEIAKKHNVPAWVIYQQTKPAKTPAGKKVGKLTRIADAAVKDAQESFGKSRAPVKSRTGGKYDEVIAELQRKRDELNTAIGALVAINT